jgi:hypothetical protein
MHTVKEMALLATKIDLLLKMFDKHGTNINTGTVKSIDLQMTCKVCGKICYSGNDCPRTHEEASFINNGYCQQGGNNIG